MTPRPTLVDILVYIMIVAAALLVLALALASPEAFSGNSAVYQKF